MSKLLENLIHKAEKTGSARVNGRMSGYGYRGDLEEKYAVEIENAIVRLRHWGTQTLEIDVVNKRILHVYGVGMSDRDGINFILNKYTMPYHVHYFPSREVFALHDEDENIIKEM